MLHMQNQVQNQETGKGPYLTQKIMSAKPEQLISYIYDAVIAGCYRKDQERVLRGLMMLVNALNFDYQAEAIPLFKLYQYCLERARRSDYSEVEELMRGVRSAWVEAMKVN